MKGELSLSDFVDALDDERPEQAARVHEALGVPPDGFDRVVWWPGDSPYSAISYIPLRLLEPIKAKLAQPEVTWSEFMHLRRKLRRLAEKYREADCA